MNKLKSISALLVMLILLNACQEENKDQYNYNEAVSAATSDADETIAEENSFSEDEFTDEYEAEMLKNSVEIPQTPETVKEESDKKAKAPVTATDPSKITVNPVSDFNQTDKMMIRTASLNMEVKNVYESTRRIEEKAAQLGAYIENSQLETNILSEETYPTTKDSALEVRRYTVSNQMSVRVPQKNLSEFLNSLNDEIQFLDHRNITAEDISLEIYKSRLEEERSKSTAGKLNQLSNEKGEIYDRKSSILAADNQQSNVIREKTERLKTYDKVAYSTVNLLISEREKIAETPVLNFKNYEQKYKPGFWNEAGNSLYGGFVLLLSLLNGLLYLWPFLFLLGLSYLAYKNLRRARN